MNRLSMKSYFDKKRKNRPVHMRKLGINKGLLAAILLVAMLAMSACGSNENERVLSAADLVEAIPEGDAHAIDVQAKEEQLKDAPEKDAPEKDTPEKDVQEKDAQEKDVQTDDINSGAESTTNQKSGSKKNSVYKSESAKIEGEIKEVKEISISSLEALAETDNLTEEKRKELLKQALVDAGKDPSVVEGKYKTKGLYFEVPENFAPLESNPNMYVTRRYSLDISNIYYQESEVDYLLQLMTEDSYKEMALQDFKETYGMDVDLQIDSFQETKISGIPSFQIESRFDLEGITIEQTTYIVNADKTYMLVYTTTNEYDTGLAFADSKDSIRVKK